MLLTKETNQNRCIDKIMIYSCDKKLEADIILFNNPSVRAGYDARLNF